MISWDDLRIFLAVARAKSLSSAAPTLGVDATTVGRRLKRLERALDARLLMPRAEGLALTPAGETMLHEAERMEQGFVSALSRAGRADTQVRGRVTLTVGDALGTRFITPRLGPLVSQHPGLELELDLESRVVDLARGEADLAIRMKPTRHEALVARKLGEVATGLYASMQYLERSGAPAEETPLSGHVVIGRGPRGARLPESEWLSSVTSEVTTHFSSYSIAAQLAAASAGLGIAALPCFWADTVPELVRIRRGDVLMREAWLVLRRDARRTARIRVVADFLADLFQAHRALLRGVLGGSVTPASTLRAR